MKKRLRQYLILIIAIIMLAIISMPTAKVYASSYAIDDEAQNTTIAVGMKLVPSSDTIHLSSDLHCTIYCYAYGYTGEYDGIQVINSNFSMSGQNATLGSTSEYNRLWEVKAIDASHNIHLQEVDALNLETLEDQTVFTGDTATFTVEAESLAEGDHQLYYQWYKDVESGSDLVLSEERSNTLEISPSDTSLYIDGTKFYCEIYGSGIDTKTNSATLTISNRYNITYKSADGTQVIKADTQKYLPNKNISLDFTNIPTKPDCKFAGWATTANSKIATYKTVENKLKMPASDVTLYAVWNAAKIVDANTSITADGLFEIGSELSIKKIQETEQVYKNTKLQLSENEEVIAAFEVKIIGNILENEIKITFLIDEKYNDKDVTVYHQKENGEIEKITGKVVNGKLTITVSELSPFMVAVEKEATKTTTGTTDNVQTGDNTVIIAGAAIVMVILINCGIIKRRKAIKSKH